MVEVRAGRRRGSGRSRLSVWGALVWFAVSYGFATAGYLLLNAVASRLLGPEQFGPFVIVLTITAAISQLALFGTHRSGLREAARLADDDDEGLLALRRGVRAVLVSSLPFSALVVGAIAFGLSDEEPVKRWVTAASVAALVWLGGLQKLWANFLRGFGKVRLASLFEGRSGGALTALLQGILTLCVFVFVPELGLTGALAATAAGYAAPVAIAWLVVSRRWGHLPRTSRLRADLAMVVARDWRFASSQLAVYLNSTVELWLAGLVLTVVDSSHFSAGQRLALLLVIPLTSLQTVFSPVTARLVATGELAVLERVLRTGATLATGVTALAWVPMILAPGPILDLVYGPGFASAAVVVMLLTFGNVGNVLTGMCGVVLAMSDHEGFLASTQWVAVTLRVALGVAAAAVWGLPGLAASAAVITVGTYAVLWFAARRRLGLRTHPTLRPDVRLIRRVTS